MLARFLAVLAVLLPAAAVAQSPCPSRLFVSGFDSTVHVFDACSGQYLRDLDTRARLAGAMAVRLGPDGLIHAVAETAGVIQKYRNDTLEYAGAFAQVPGIGATGLAFDAAGVAYVAGYVSDDVKRFARDGAALGPAFPARSSGLNGPDNGLTFGPDGNLYVPSYDTHSVVRFDPRTGATSVAVPPRTAGLFLTRGLLPARDGQHMFITSEGSGTVLRWHLATGAVAVFATGLTRPTGIDYAPDGRLLVSHGDGVVKLDADTGARLETFVAPAAGGIAGQVFIAVIPVSATAPVDAAQVGTQYWLVGDATFAGRVLDLPAALSATGTAFGPALDFTQLAVKRWGSVRVELVSCTQARFSWDAAGAGSAGFGAGGYDAFRYFDNEATARCLAQGVDHPDKSWVNGQWWGGAARSGEGWFLDRHADGRAFFAWFTHRPPAGAAADAAQVGSQYWVVGDARFEGRALRLDSVFSATGTAFGPALDFNQLAVKRWGSVRIELVSCTQATFTWDSTGAGSANFGSGGYAIFRYFENEDTARCRQQGLDHADRSWVNGQWWGGEARSGEGLFLDRRADGTTFFAWFTHRPR
jgi:sugar lactone lactonase YvrE